MNTTLIHPLMCSVVNFFVAQLFVFVYSNTLQIHQLLLFKHSIEFWILNTTDISQQKLVLSSRQASLDDKNEHKVP